MKKTPKNEYVETPHSKAGHDQENNDTAYSGRKVFLQLSGLISVFLILLGGSYVFFNIHMRDNNANAVRLQAAALQRMFITDYTHRTASLVTAPATGTHQVVAANTAAAREVAGHITANYDALLNGGAVILSIDGTKSANIAGFTDRDIVKNLATARTEWMELQRQAAPLLQAEGQPDRNSFTYGDLDLQFYKTVIAEDAVVKSIDKHMQRQGQSWAAKQDILLGIGILTFLLTLLYARNAIALPIEKSSRALLNHQKNLKKTVRRKTADIAQARDRLKQELAMQEAILNNMLQGVITIDESGKILSFNKWARKTFGYKEKEVIGKNVNMLMPEPYHSQHDQYLRNYAETGKAKIIGIGRDDVQGKRKNGKTFPIALSVSEVANQSKTVFVGLVSDISEQKEKEQAILEAREAAIQANQAKSDFLANVSHELRTPLNSIIGMSRLMCEDGDMTEDSINTATIVHRSAQSLLDIVNDILDLSKVEAGQIALENIAFSYKEVFSDVMDELVLPASEKGLLLSHKVDGNGVEYIVGDPLRLRRIIVNLVSNAVKYTEEGSVTVAYAFKAGKKSKNKAVLSCSVTDTGIGIPEDKLETIFDKFAQADASTTRRFGGTGLGLSITKELVELMDGKLSVESTPGKGSTFSFEIPFRVAQRRDNVLKKEISADVTITAKDQKPIAKASILIAEDHLMNQAFMRKLFKRWGVRNYDIVETGIEAIQAWQDNDYDLILMDCHMPEKSGLDAATEIRQAEAAAGDDGDKAHVPIIALTADAMLGTRERCITAGMDYYVAKPVDIDELHAVLEKFFHFPDEDAKAEARSQAPTDPLNLDLLKTYAGTEEELAELVDIFLTESQKSITTLQDNQTSGQNEAWSEAAHKLKGGAGMMGAETLRILCEQAQAMSDVPRDARRQAFKKLKKEYARVCDAIENLKL